ncbi:MAG: RhuM family protein [Microbacteriaceae bacterium]
MSVRTDSLRARLVDNQHERRLLMAGQPLEDVILYQRDDGALALDVRLDAETVWLSQQQIADLFQTSRENITMHLRNVFDEGELDSVATSKDFLQVRQEGERTVRRKVAHYNLDAIISVGYRVKSKVATQFRIWATERLRDILVKGYAINEQRLEQLGSIVQILGRSTNDLVSGVADVIGSYLPGLTLLRDYDEGGVESAPHGVPGWTLTSEDARAVIQHVAARFPADSLLGEERGGVLDGTIAAIYQGFAGEDLYPTIEEKAANLLYLVVKDHPLADGNKRSAAALFVTFLAYNGMLNDESGAPRITNNALAAVTLMIAMSAPKEKDLMVALLIRMIIEGGKHYASI